MAPEQMKYNSPQLNNKRGIPTPAVDIYAIGKTMLSLMELTNREETKAYGYDVAAYPTVPMSTQASFYSNGLRQWIQQCLHPTPAIRPYADYLWGQVATATERAAHGSAVPPPRWRSLPPDQQLLYKGSNRYDKWAM